MSEREGLFLSVITHTHTHTLGWATDVCQHGGLNRVKLVAWSKEVAALHNTQITNISGVSEEPMYQSVLPRDSSPYFLLPALTTHSRFSPSL